MSLQNDIANLERIADASTCEGECEKNGLMAKCAGCEAYSLLNEISKDIHEAFRLTRLHEVELGD